MRRNSPPFKRKNASLVLPQLVISSERVIGSACQSSTNEEDRPGNRSITKPTPIFQNTSHPSTPSASCSPQDSGYISEDSPHPSGFLDSRTSSVNSSNSGSVFDSISGSDATSLLPPRNKSILRPRFPRIEADYFTRKVSPFQGGTYTDSYICDKKLSVVLGIEPMTDLGLDENEWNESFVRGARINKRVSFGATTIFPVDMEEEEVELEHVEDVMFEGNRTGDGSGDDGDDGDDGNDEDDEDEGEDGDNEAISKGMNMDVSEVDTRSKGKGIAMSD
jgi:hypothetical protein